MSSFLTAHQHIIGYSVPLNPNPNDIRPRNSKAHPTDGPNPTRPTKAFCKPATSPVYRWKSAEMSPVGMNSHTRNAGGSVIKHYTTNMAMLPYGWQGNRGSGVWHIHLLSQGLSIGDEHPDYTPYRLWVYDTIYLTLNIATKAPYNTQRCIGFRHMDTSRAVTG